MFARVLDEMKEPFRGSPSASDKQGMRSIQTYYSKTLPNIIYNNDPKIDVVSLTEVSNTRIASNQDTLRQKWLQTDDNKKLLEQKEADCKNNRGLDPFDRLTQLNDTEDQTSRLRCGWIYNKTNPTLGGGAFGVKDGPISSKAPGVWNWDLKLATEQMHVDICKNIQNCSDIDRLSLKKRCGWCERLQKGVPITKSGAVAYPWNKMGGCPASNTVTSGSKCPAKPPPDPDEDTIPEPCDPLPDGRMSRACMLTKYKDAGCSDNGALGTALARGTDTDYVNSIYSQKAYQIYQQRAPLGLNEYGLKRGKMSMNDALNEFDRLASSASKTPSGGNALDFATRDLCLKQGELDNFDFCSELKGSTVGPYTMDCLQKAFIKAGGEKNGLMYPSPSTMSRWNSMPNWAAVLAEMQAIKRDASSSDPDLKYNGTRKFIDANTPDPFQCSTRLLPRKVVLSRGNVIGRFTMTQDYKLEFNVTPRGIVGGWGSIFHFSSNGNNCCSLGERSPAIWFFPSGLTLHIRIGDSTDGNWGVDLNGCSLNKKSNIALHCIGKSVKVIIDGVTHSFTQPTYRYSGPITVYASDPWHDVPKATVDNICLQTIGNSTSIPKCSPPFGNPPGEVAGWEYKGCWRDCRQGRGLPVRLPNVNSIEKCIEQAKAAGYNTAGNQFFGECWAGNNTDWNKMGDAGCCEPLGGNCTQQIYSAKKPKDLTIAEFQTMFEKAGCTNKLGEGGVTWWRGRANASDVQNDMKAYANLTKECSGNKGQHEFCISGKCKEPVYDPTKPIRIKIGNSDRNEKVVPLPRGLPSTFRNVKHIPQGYLDEYVYRIEGNNLIVRRVDHFGGWGAQNEAEISSGVQPHVPNIAYVRIEGGDQPLNMSQLVVLNELGQNISKGKPQQVRSETYSDANKRKANDGGEAPRHHPNQYHGRGNRDDMWQVELGGTHNVSAVIIYNRSDCCSGRMNGYVIKLYAPNPSGGFREVFTSRKLIDKQVQVVKTVK